LEKLGIVIVRKFELNRWIEVGLKYFENLKIVIKSGRKIGKYGNLGK
jgi:hypothetical protein